MQGFANFGPDVVGYFSDLLHASLDVIPSAFQAIPLVPQVLPGQMELDVKLVTKGTELIDFASQIVSSLAHGSAPSCCLGV